MAEFLEVALSYGRIRGLLSGPLAVFRGIPYAAPPIGDRRFAPVAPPKSWPGVRDALEDGPISPQAASRAFTSMGPISAPQNEDCLTVTVWAPREPAEPLPVMVWLHGGGFQSGAASLPWYDGGRLAIHGCVVVGVNYRVGPLGYLSIPAVGPANLGTLDQEAAIRWVNREIRAFGGDPGRVTLFGQSGGGHTIAELLQMARTNGLFQRAILQSPPLGISVYSRAEADAAAAAFVAPLGLALDTPGLAERLREIPVDELLRANGVGSQGTGRMAQGDVRPLLMPVREPPLEPDIARFAEDAGEAAAVRGIDVMIGWTREEANLFLTSFPPPSFSEHDLLAVAETRLGDGAVAQLNELRARRPGAGPIQLFSDLITELAFRAPSLALAQSAARSGGDAFAYQFDWPSPLPGLAACHCIELPFVFGTWEAWREAPMLAGVTEDEFRAISDEVMDRWFGFAVSGDPGFAAWRPDAPSVLHIDRKPTLQTT